MSDTPLSDLWEQAEPEPWWRRARWSIPHDQVERIAAWVAVGYVALVVLELAVVLRP